MNSVEHSATATHTPDPFAPTPEEVFSEEELTRQLVLVGTRRYAQQRGAFNRGATDARLFGAFVEELRAQRSWTCLDLARKAGINPVYVVLPRKWRSQGKPESRAACSSDW